MGIFENIFSRNKNNTPKTVEDLYIEILGNSKDITINENNIMEMPMVKACVSLIANKIATVPIKLYRDVEGKTEEILKDKRSFLLNRESGDIVGSYEMKFNMISDYLLSGESYSYIEKDGNKVQALRYIDNSEINIFSNYNPVFREISYSVRGMEFQPWELLILNNSKDGYSCKGILQDNQEILRTAWYLLRINKINSKNGNVPKGVLESEKNQSREVLDSIKQGWKKMFSNPDEDDSCVILNAGIKYKQISTSAKDSQLLELSNDLDKKICSIFGVPYELVIGSGTQEHEKSFIKNTIIPLLKKFELELNKSLLLESEKLDGYFFVFDLQELLKDDIKTRYEAYEKGIQKGFLQINEVRHMEHLPPIDGLDGYVKLNLADVLYNPATEKIFTPNTNKTLNLNATNEMEVNA